MNIILCKTATGEFTTEIAKQEARDFHCYRQQIVSWKFICSLRSAVKASIFVLHFDTKIHPKTKKKKEN